MVYMSEEGMEQYWKVDIAVPTPLQGDIGQEEPSILSRTENEPGLVRE